MSGLASAGDASSGRDVLVVAVQTGPAGDDLAGNLEGSGELAVTAGEADLIVFPELFARPFWCLGASDPAYFAWAETTEGPVVTFASQLAERTGATVVAPFFERGPITGEYYNSAAVVGPDGRLVGGRMPDGRSVDLYRKNSISAFRSQDQVNDEKFYFRPGDGYAVFDTPKARIGVLICLDRWYPEAWRVLALAGAEVICVVNASQGDVDDLFVPSMRTCAAQNIVHAVAVNKVGTERVGERSAHYYGQSCIVEPRGLVVAQAPPDRPAAISARLDLHSVSRTRLERTYYRDRRPDLFGSLAGGAS
ncbi:MAG: beta-ureidopropionase [Nocardioidaceae bacterium]|nr:beta-ureidopropionase [Nocardioidaceae bacterium]